jgi:hypothetical protein
MTMNFWLYQIAKNMKNILKLKSIFVICLYNFTSQTTTQLIMLFLNFNYDNVSPNDENIFNNFIFLKKI